jgi:hypothetical protein
MLSTFLCGYCTPFETMKCQELDKNTGIHKLVKANPELKSSPKKPGVKLRGKKKLIPLCILGIKKPSVYLGFTIIKM